MSNRSIALAVAAVVIGLDQLTKWWALNALDDGPITVLGEFLTLKLVFNPGAAFNSLQGSGVLIAVIAIVVVLVLVRVSGSAEHRHVSGFDSCAGHLEALSFICPATVNG